VPVRRIGLPGDRFVDHGAVTDLRRTLRLDTAGIPSRCARRWPSCGLARRRGPALGARGLNAPARRRAAARRAARRARPGRFAAGTPRRCCSPAACRVGSGDGARLDRKPGELLAPTHPSSSSQVRAYVSRGGEKLEAALDAFGDRSGRPGLPRRGRLDRRLHRLSVAARRGARLCSRRGARTARRVAAQGSPRRLLERTHAGRLDPHHPQASRCPSRSAWP
jgi:hypothetical protein